MTDVTDADRAKAHRIWNEALCNAGIPGWDRDAALAAALAEEREKAREPFLRLAEELSQPVLRIALLLPDRDMGRNEGEDAERIRCANRIRQAADMTTAREETP